MSSQKLQRTAYRDPNQVGNPPRVGTVDVKEAGRDMDQFYRPLEQIHGSSFHGWGVACGLRVTAAAGCPDVKVLPGVALDTSGRQISLAAGGSAETGQNADAPGAVPTLASVTASGVTIPTAGLSGDKYLTIQFWESFDSQGYIDYGVYRYDHTPWIQLLDVAGFVNDGSRIVLAKVSLNGAGLVNTLSEGLRRGADVPVETVHLRRNVVATPAPNFAVDSSDTAQIRARAAGGLEMLADQIGIRSNSGTETISIDAPQGVLSVGASGVHGDVIVRDASNATAIHLDGRYANITVGATGNEGDILVKDANNRLVITLDGAAAQVVVGGQGNAGEVIVKDASAVDTARLDGSKGAANLKRIAAFAGNLIDVDSTFLRIHGWDLCLDGRSGNNNRALVDGGNTLYVNYANDYSNGVSINKLHLQDHIKAYCWSDVADWNPGRYDWHVFFEMDTGLKNAEWLYTTNCEIGMYDEGTVDNFWWGTQNWSETGANGNIIIKWAISYYDTGTDWYPWTRSVSWIAFRR